MTEQELQQQRARIWRVDGNPVRTIDDAAAFLDEVGFCSMVAVRPAPLIATFLGAYAGSAAGLPDAKHAFADPRVQPATDLMVRLLRTRKAYEVVLSGDTELLVSSELFPYFYALVGDRHPKDPPRTKAQGARLSPLALKVYETIERHGPLSKGQLQAQISRELTSAALDRALHELWSILKITRVDYNPDQGASWDLMYRWSPNAVIQGINISQPEAVSALLGKYLEAVVAAEQEEIEQMFSLLLPRSRIREAIHALLAAREINLITVGTKSMIQLAPVPGASGHPEIGTSRHR